MHAAASAQTQEPNEATAARSQPQQTQQVPSPTQKPGVAASDFHPTQMTSLTLPKIASEQICVGQPVAGRSVAGVPEGLKCLQNTFKHTTQANVNKFFDPANSRAAAKATTSDAPLEPELNRSGSDDELPAECEVSSPSSGSSSDSDSDESEAAPKKTAKAKAAKAKPGAAEAKNQPKTKPAPNTATHTGKSKTVHQQPQPRLLPRRQRRQRHRQGHRQRPHRRIPRSDFPMRCGKFGISTT